MKAKKHILATISALIIANQGYATGIPTIDVGALTQSVLSYMEQLQSNVNILKQYSSQLDQMKEQGIGMNIGEILGDTKGIINKIQNNIGFSIDEDLMQETKDITDVCAYLEQNSKYFKESINKVGEKLENKVNACIATSGTNSLTKTINELKDELSEIDYNEVDKRNEIEHKINMLQQAQNFLNNQANNQKSSKILALYDNYLQGDANNPYSKSKMDEDLLTLSNQLKNANNQKQATALTNTMLLKLLEVSQRQYELSLNLASMNASESKSPSPEISYTQEKPKIIKTEDLETVKRFKEEYGEALYDEYGMPDMSMLAESED